MTNKSMSIANDKNLLTEIEKMLGAKSGEYLKNNSLLGFCARLIAAKPEARSEFQKKLGRKLSREQKFLFPTLYIKQPATFNLREKISRFRLNLLPRLLTLRSLSAAASFTIIAVFGLNEANHYLPPSGSVQETPTISNLQPNAFASENQSQRVLKEDRALKLVEYTLFDGSKVIALENILL